MAGFEALADVLYKIIINEVEVDTTEELSVFLTSILS